MVINYKIQPVCHFVASRGEYRNTIISINTIITRQTQRACHFQPFGMLLKYIFHNLVFPVIQFSRPRFQNVFDCSFIQIYYNFIFAYSSNIQRILYALRFKNSVYKYLYKLASGINENDTISPVRKPDAGG